MDPVPCEANPGTQSSVFPPVRLAVKASSVPGAGFGLFADEPLAAYVVLGEMLGVHRSYAELGQKMRRVGHDTLHPFYVGPGVVIDPTNDSGELDPASLSMAFANEAPPGQLYNVLAMYSNAAERLPGVFFVTRQPVEAGDELFVCYGYDYDRPYDTATPDREEDAALRVKACLRHPWLSPQFPLESLVSCERGQDTIAEHDASPPGNSGDEQGKSRFEVGTEEWRCDLSDVILPLPVYDSDSEDDSHHAATSSTTAPRTTQAPWEELSPERVLHLMSTHEKHSHEKRRLGALPRPTPLPGVAGVRRLDAAAAAEQMDQLVGSALEPGEPVIVLGLATGWRASERWLSAEAFVRHYGSMPLKVYDMASMSGMGKVTELWLPARDYVKYAENATSDAPFYVFQKKFVDGLHDPLFEDYSCPELFAEDLWSLTPELRGAFVQNRFFCLGGERTGSALHVDPHFTGAWNTLLCGEKRWVLFPPEVSSSEIGVPDDLREKLTTPCSYWWHDWYPRLAGPHGKGASLGMREVVQLPGETIYVPAGWWHAVLNHGWTIAVTENQLAPGALARSWPKLLDGNPRLARHLARAIRDLRPDLLPRLPPGIEAEADRDEPPTDAEAPVVTESDDGFRMW